MMSLVALIFELSWVLEGCRVCRGKLLGFQMLAPIGIWEVDFNIRVRTLMLSLTTYDMRDRLVGARGHLTPGRTPALY
jgi:hypothetical protein